MAEESLEFAKENDRKSSYSPAFCFHPFCETVSRQQPKSWPNGKRGGGRVKNEKTKQKQ